MAPIWAAACCSRWARSGPDRGARGGHRHARSSGPSAWRRCWASAAARWLSRRLPPARRRDLADGRGDHRRRPRAAGAGPRNGRRPRPAGRHAEPHAGPHRGPDGQPAPGQQRRRPRPAHAAVPAVSASGGCAGACAIGRRVRSRDRGCDRARRRACWTRSPPCCASRRSKARRPSPFARVDLSALAETVADAYRPDAEEAGHADRTIAPGVFVSGDQELLTQALANLVENALRHTPPGTRIDVRLQGSRKRHGPGRRG